jgi:AraC-like DNA-binding protein
MAEVEPARASLETRDPELVAETLAALYGRAQLCRPAPDFAFRQSVLSARGLSMGRWRFQGGAMTTTDPVGLIAIGHIRSGHYVLESGGRQVDTSPPLWLVPPDSANRVELDGLDLEFFNIDLAILDELSREMTGRDSFRLRFAGSAPTSPTAVQHWIATVRHLQHDVLGNAEVWANPLIRSQAIRALATATLQLFPNNVDENQPASEEVDPPAVRRAKLFIEENLGRDISAHDIAQAARVSLRGLQSAFRRHAGESPTAYLRRARLDAAHSELLAGEAGTSVERVARRWGFSHMGRFAQDYRETFGQLPSATLRGDRPGR